MFFNQKISAVISTGCTQIFRSSVPNWSKPAAKTAIESEALARSSVGSRFSYVVIEDVDRVVSARIGSARIGSAPKTGDNTPIDLRSISTFGSLSFVERPNLLRFIDVEVIESDSTVSQLGIREPISPSLEGSVVALLSKLKVKQHALNRIQSKCTNDSQIKKYDDQLKLLTDMVDLTEKAFSCVSSSSGARGIHAQMEALLTQMDRCVQAASTQNHTLKRVVAKLTKEVLEIKRLLYANQIAC